MIVYHPTRGRVLVRRVDSEERLGSLIVPERARDGMTKIQVEVVALGPPERCEGEDCRRTHEAGCHPMPARAGDWVLLRTNFSLIATEDPRQFVIHQDDICGIFV